MVKLKQLEVKNFQSLKDCTIDFDESGVYHVAGKHNIGKSAVVKAINTLFQNVSRYKYKYYIRDNETSFYIKGTFHDGSEITLSRGENDYYEWKLPSGDGIFNRTDGKIPVEVEKYLNLYIDNEKTKECLNIRTPRSKLLFVDTTVGDNYYLFQKALKTEEFVLATRLANSKKRRVSTNIKKVEEYKENAEYEYKNKKGEYQKQSKDYDDLVKVKAKIDNEMETYNQLKSFVNTADTVTKIVKELESMNLGITLDKVIKETKLDLDKVIAIKNYMLVLNEIKQLNQELTETKSQLDLIKEVDKEVTQTEQINQYLEQIKSIEVMEEEINTIDSISTEFDSLNNTIKSYSIYTEMEGIRSEMTEMVTEFKSLTEILKMYDTINLQTYSTLYQVNTMMKDVEEVTKNIELAEQEYKNSDKEMMEFMKEHKFCPIVAMSLDKRCPFGEEIK